MSERGKPKGGVAIFPRENRSAARNRSGESHHTFDKCGSIFKRLKLIGANDFMQLSTSNAY
jgi:hypothetical protein